MKIGDEPVRANLQLHYTLKAYICNLSISEAFLQVSDGSKIPVIVFQANFHNDLKREEKDERLDELIQIIENWKTTVIDYEMIINDKILG